MSSSTVCMTVRCNGYNTGNSIVFIWSSSGSEEKNDAKTCQSPERVCRRVGRRAGCCGPGDSDGHTAGARDETVRGERVCYGTLGSRICSAGSARVTKCAELDCNGRVTGTRHVGAECHPYRTGYGGVAGVRADTEDTGTTRRTRRAPK